MIKFLITPFLLLLWLTSCSTPSPNSSLLTDSNSNSSPAPLPISTEISYLDQGKILQLVSDKVYQVMVKKKNEHLITYNRDIPTETIPFELRESSYQSIGSAFSLIPGRYLSCAHVFNLHLRPNPEEFFLKDSKGKIYNITQIHRYSVHHDIIEFSLSDNIQLPTLTKNTNNTMGETVFSIGNALGVGISVRSGVLSSFTFEPDFGEWKNIRFSAPASPGNSGGPLVNDHGEVIGLIQAKSENENLNYAFPMNLIDEVPSKQALVKTKQQFSPYGLRDIFIIDYQNNLPQKIDSLQRDLYSQFQKMAKKHAEEFFQKNKNQLFNADSKIESYLYFQTISKSWQKLTKKRNGLWSSYAPPFDVEKFSDGDELAFAITGQMEDLTVFFSHFIYQKKNPGSLEKLINNPAPIMSRVINQILGGVKFGQTSIDIKDIKEAEETYWYRDQIKRLWRIDFWRLKSFGLSIITACTSHPKGLACHLFPPMESNYEGYGALSLIQYELDAWMLAPTGTIAQWQEYLKLPTKYQWPLLDNARLSFDKKNLNLSVYPYALNLSVPDIFNRLEVSINLGYENKLPLRVKNHGLGIFDAFGRTYFYHLSQGNPEHQDDEEQNVLWRQALLRQAEFSGEVVKDQQEKKVILVGFWNEGKFKEHKATDSTENLPKEMQKIFCYTDLHHSDALLKEWCYKFGSQLRTKL